MQLMLTSFGVAENDFEYYEYKSLFHSMPPVNMRGLVNKCFMPDFSALILCDNVILDESTFDTLQNNRPKSYFLMAKTIEKLYDEGFVKLINYRHILKRNENLLQKMLEHDLKMFDQWIVPLQSSLDIWNQFISRSHGVVPFFDYDAGYHYCLHCDTDYINKKIYDECHLIIRNLKSFTNKKNKDVLKPVLQSYLSYVNANIVLSNEIGVGFHDWADFLPFYRLKFLPIGKEKIENECQIEEAQKLFEVSFPEFTITSANTLIKALKDKRITDLREMVDGAVRGEITFNQEFANSILKEVLGVEKRIERYRKIISYVTIPIGFTPWIGTVAEKIIEETADILLERKLKQKHKWFYLLSDLAEESKGKV